MKVELMLHNVHLIIKIHGTVKTAQTNRMGTLKLLIISDYMTISEVLAILGEEFSLIMICFWRFFIHSVRDY